MPDVTGGRPEPRPPRPVRLSIVVPAYNEGGRLDTGVGRLAAAIAAGAVDAGATEVIVVDDGSTDDTGRRAVRLLGDLVPHQLITLAANTGKGAAVRAGVDRAGGDVVAYMDADMAIDPVQIPRLVAALGDADVAIGSRALPGTRVDYDDPRRNLEGRAFNLLVNLLTGVRLHDTQCGFKAFRAPVARVLFAATVIERFAFDVEVLAAARRLGLRIAEVAVEWDNVPGTHIRPLADPLSMVTDLVRSRTGRLAAPPLCTLRLVPVGRATTADDLALEARTQLGDRTLPVLVDRGGRVLVVVPPGVEAAAVASGLGSLRGVEVEAPVLLTPGQLRALGPLRVLPAPGPEAATPAAGRRRGDRAPIQP